MPGSIRVGIGECASGENDETVIKTVCICLSLEKHCRVRRCDEILRHILPGISCPGEQIVGDCRKFSWSCSFSWQHPKLRYVCSRIKSKRPNHVSISFNMPKTMGLTMARYAFAGSGIQIGFPNWYLTRVFLHPLLIFPKFSHASLGQGFFPYSRFFSQAAFRVLVCLIVFSK